MFQLIQALTLTGLWINWILSTIVRLYHVCWQSYCECVWPLDHEIHSLIVLQQTHTSSSFFAMDHLRLPRKKEQLPLSCCLAFHQTRSSQSGHTTGGLFLFTHPFALFSWLPWDPRHTLGKGTCIIVNQVLHSFGNAVRNNGWLPIKTDADRCLCHMFSTDHWITSGLICSDKECSISLVQLAWEDINECVQLQFPSLLMNNF